MKNIINKDLRERVEAYDSSRKSEARIQALRSKSVGWKKRLRKQGMNDNKRIGSALSLEVTEADMQVAMDFSASVRSSGHNLHMLEGAQFQ